MTRGSALGIGLLALLAGCGSPQTQYYTLAPVPPAGAPGAAKGRPVMIRDLMLPADLDRLSFVEANGPTRLAISDQDRWAAPLEDMTRRVLAADLQARLPGLVLLPGDPVPATGVRGLVVNIRQFASDTSGHGVLQVDWSLLAGHPAKPVMRHAEAIPFQAASGKAADVVTAMSAALGTLADRITAGLSQA